MKRGVDGGKREGNKRRGSKEGDCCTRFIRSDLFCNKWRIDGGERRRKGREEDRLETRIGEGG